MGARLCEQWSTAMCKSPVDMCPKVKGQRAICEKWFICRVNEYKDAIKFLSHKNNRLASLISICYAFCIIVCRMRCGLSWMKNFGHWWLDLLIIFTSDAVMSDRFMDDQQSLSLKAIYHHISHKNLMKTNTLLLSPLSPQTDYCSPDIVTLLSCFHQLFFMMTSPNGYIFRVTGPLWGESTGHRWIPLTKASDAEIWCLLWSAPEQTVEQRIGTSLIWDAIALIMTSQ